MSILTSLFSTRELAIFTWVISLLLLLSFNRGTRGASWQLLRAFCDKKILGVFTLMVVYVAIITWMICRVGLWDFPLLKDTVFWFFTVASVTFFNINKADDLNFFKDIVLDSVKLTVIVEFLVNFYTFSLWIEFIIVPLVIIGSLLY